MLMYSKSFTILLFDNYIRQIKASVIADKEGYFTEILIINQRFIQTGKK